VKREQKVQVADKLKEELAHAAAAVVVEYKGITVESLHQLRVKLREKASRIRVVKNTLFTRACEGTDNAKLAELAGGPIAVAYTSEDPTTLAKELTSFAKKEEKLIIRGGILTGKLMDQDGVKELATMPSFEEMRAKVLGLLNAPAQQFLSLLQAAPRNFLGVLKAREEQVGSESNG